ncbi:MAG: tetratricopeptide repeat protein, partial [Nitrospiraceae bacterium]|nr:tetratricopeptide repeat protein [Nitrospiraceae bacterium]
DTLTSMGNLALTLQDQGDLAGAREIQEEVLETTWRVLGSEHPSTSISAWNLFSTYVAMGDSVGARTVLETDLLWLRDRDPASLGADQQKIREMIL